MTTLANIDVSRMVSMLDMASRDTTPDGEAVNALRLVRRNLGQAGLDFLNVIHLTRAPNGVIRETISVLRRENTELRNVVAAREAEIAQLYETIRNASTVQAQPVDVQADVSDDTSSDTKSFYTWIDFVNAGTARFGKSKGFQVAFIEAYPEFKGGDLAAWRRLNQVPARALELIAVMPVVYDSTRGVDWTEKEHEFLRNTLTKTPKIKMAALATLLTQQFGRVISEGAAKAAKYRFYNQ